MIDLGSPDKGTLLCYDTVLIGLVQRIFWHFRNSTHLSLLNNNNVLVHICMHGNSMSFAISMTLHKLLVYVVKCTIGILKSRSILCNLKDLFFQFIFLHGDFLPLSTFNNFGEDGNCA